MSFGIGFPDEFAGDRALDDFFGLLHNSILAY